MDEKAHHLNVPECFPPDGSLNQWGLPAGRSRFRLRPKTGLAAMRYRQPRFAADTQVRIGDAAAQSRARLVNISSTGARLADLGVRTRGEMLILSHLSARICVRVVWSNERLTGVAFGQPRSQTQVNSIRGVGDSAASGTWSFKPLRELT